MSFSGELGKGYLGALELGAAGAEADLEQSVETIISLVSIASGSAGLDQSVETVIALTSDGSGIRTIPESTTSTIVLVDSATERRDLEGIASSVIVLVDSAAGDATHPTSDTLVLTSDATFNADFSRGASSALGLVSTGSFVGPHYEYPSTLIDLQSSVNFNFSLIVHAFTILSLDSGAGRGKPASATSTLVLVSSATHTNLSAATAIVLVSSAEGHKGLKNTLNIIEVATFTAIFKRPVSSQLESEQTVSFFLITDTTDCLYSPFVGSSTDPDAPTPPSTTIPTLGDATLTLTYPFVSPTNTLVMRNPEFGDKDSLEFNRINRLTRGGKSILFADRKWPKQQVLSFDIVALTETQAQDYLDFISQSLGKEVGLLDHENRQWRGIIMNPDASITDGGRTCNYSTSLQFEGVLV